MIRETPESAVVIDQMIQRQVDIEREVDRLKALGAVELDADGQPEEPRTLADVGIVNRRSARRAGLRNPQKKQPRMATRL